MPFIDANDAAQIAERIISIDRVRLADDPFKLTLALFHLVESRLAAYNSAVQRLSVASGTRSSNSQQAKDSLERLADLLRSGFKSIDAIPDFRVPANQRLAALESYGFAGGKLGNLVQKERLLALGRLAISVTPTIQPETVRMPADIVGRIQEEIDLLEDAEPGSRIGNRSTATKRRDNALKDLRRAISRIRFYYASCSDDIDTSTEFAKLGLNPRKVSGQRRIAGEGSTPSAPTP